VVLSIKVSISIWLCYTYDRHVALTQSPILMSIVVLYLQLIHVSQLSHSVSCKNVSNKVLPDHPVLVESFFRRQEAGTLSSLQDLNSVGDEVMCISKNIPRLQ